MNPSYSHMPNSTRLQLRLQLRLQRRLSLPLLLRISQLLRHFLLLPLHPPRTQYLHNHNKHKNNPQHRLRRLSYHSHNPNRCTLCLHVR